MGPETKTCQNCKQNFVIHPEDEVFYQKMDVPKPTLCPPCRSQRRLVQRNERVLFKRTCGLCGKNIISMYSEEKPFPVCCSACWYSDKWDPLSFGTPVNLGRSFFEQFRELQAKVPRISLFNINSVNSDYSNYSLDNKDCYFAFRLVGSERCHYVYYCINGVDCANSLYIHKSDLINDSYSIRNCHNCRNLVNCENCINSAYSYDLKNCSYCLFCHNLRNKNYCLRNKQVSQEEFQRSWNEVISGSRMKARDARRIFNSLYKEKSIHRCNNIVKCANASGVDLVNCKDVFQVYNGVDSENVRYSEDIETTRDSMDLKGPMDSELSYESCSIDNGCSKLLFSNFCKRGCVDVYYSSFCINSSNLFGCISVRDNKHCVLNKQYPPEEYQTLKAKLIEGMTKTGEFGENFPVAMSPFAYNETVAMEYFPLTKDGALGRGYVWQDQVGGTFGQETVAQDDLPDEIKNVPDSVVGEVLKCEACGKNYRIVKDELDFYRRLPAPLPEKCPHCRYYDLLKFRFPHELWTIKCYCAGAASRNSLYKNSNQHFHGSAPCPSEFKTPYSPEGSEIVYCEQCYNAEVV